jgi:hypothetical protein
MEYGWNIPPDMDKTQDIEIIIYSSLAAAETNGDFINMNCSWIAIGDADTSLVSQTSSSVLGNTEITTAGGIAIRTAYANTLVLPADDATNPLADATSLVYRVDLTDINDITGVYVHAAAIRYTALY